MNEDEIEIVIVEDDEDILELIEFHFQKAGYSVTGFTSTENVEQFLEEENPSLMILDRNLPGREGSEYLKYLKDVGYDIPTIILSAKSKELEIEEGFTSGADDYMSKPFNTSELLLRVKALLKRSGKIKKQNRLKHKLLTIDLDKKDLFVDGKPVDITRLEFNILYTFFMNIGVDVSRDDLRDSAWGDAAEETDDNTVNVAINRLKKKIDPNKKYNYLKSIWGVGYNFS